MKKTMLTAMTAISVMIAALTGCGGSGAAGTAAAPAEKTSEAPDAAEQSAPAAAEGKKVRVAIVQPMTHTSLDQIRDTIIANLTEDTDIEIVTQNANGDTAALTSIPRPRQPKRSMTEKRPRSSLPQYLTRWQRA